MYPASARRPKDGGSRLHSRLHLAQRTTDYRTAEHQTVDRRRDDLYGTGLRKHSSSGLSLLAAVKRSFKRKFDQRNEPVKWRTQSDVLHLLLQKNKTVFHREAPFQHVWVTAISISCSPVVSFKVTVSELALVGMATPTSPVTASGFRNESSPGKSPTPLPKNTAGVHVVNVSAPTCLRPVPPTSTSAPNESRASFRCFFENSYFALSSRLPNPLTEPSRGGWRLVNVSPTSIPRFGVMRLAISTEISASRVPPSSGVTMLETVGSDSSSLTNGSSVESVAGKNLLPAKPCPQMVSGLTSITMNPAAIITTAALSDPEKRCDEIFIFFSKK